MRRVIRGEGRLRKVWRGAKEQVAVSCGKERAVGKRAVEAPGLAPKRK